MKLKLSQCMIVKNEEENIERALSWGKGIVSEQIVVDTGSTDHTIEIAKKMGAKVFSFEWVQDFSAAKNYAITKASGDWILFLDADEYFRPEDAKKIPKILLAFSMKNLKKGKEQLLGDIIHTDLIDLDADENVISVHTQARIFRNSPHIRYYGAIHEYVGSDPNHPAFIAKIGNMLPIYHTGYAWKGEEQRKKKGERNLTLIKNELEKNPDHALMQFYMAESLCVNYEWDEAMAYAKKAIENKDGSLKEEQITAAYQLIFYELYRRAIEKEEDAFELEKKMRELYEKAVLVMPNHPDFDLALGFLCFYEKKWREAQEYLERALKKAEASKKLFSSKFPSVLEQIYDELTEACKKNGEIGKMMRYAVSYLKEIDPYQEALTKRVLQAFSEDRTVQAEEVLRFLMQLYQIQSKKDLFYLLKCCKIISYTELELKLKEFLSPEQKENLYPERKKLEKPDGCDRVATDKDFYELAENIWNTTEGALLLLIQENWKKISQEQVSTAYMISQGKLDLEKKETSLMENRAKALCQSLDKYIWLFERLADHRSKKILSYLMRNWISFGVTLLTAIKERLNPPYLDADLYIPDKKKAVVDIGTKNEKGLEQYRAVYGEAACSHYYFYELGEQAYESTALSVDSTEAIIRNMELEEFSLDMEEPIGLLKIDAEGKERALLKKITTLIERDRPVIAVSAWYYCEEIVELAEEILAIDPAYQLYLRYYGGEFYPDGYGLIAVIRDSK